MHDVKSNTAHCRRRKIQCLLAEGISQQRCGNRIRPKKKCVAYPVDQQIITESPSQSSNKVDTGCVPSSVNPPSPPELASERPFDRAYQLGSFPSLPSDAPQGKTRTRSHRLKSRNSLKAATPVKAIQCEYSIIQGRLREIKHYIGIIQEQSDQVVLSQLPTDSKADLMESVKTTAKRAATQQPKTMRSASLSYVLRSIKVRWKFGAKIIKPVSEGKKSVTARYLQLKVGSHRDG